MKKQIFATKMMVALLTWLFISISCSKKNDILMVEQPSAEQQKKVVDRFLNTPDNVSKELNYIIDNIRKTEEKTPFLYAFAQRNGFPNWQKITGNIPIYAPEYNKQVHVTDVAINAINSNQISNPNSTATLFIPLQDTVTKEIKAYIYCQKSLDGTVTYKTYNKAAILQTPPSSKEDIKTKGVLLSVFAHFEKSINHKNELQLPVPYNYTFKDVVVSFSNNKTATENSDMVFDEGCKDGHIYISISQLFLGFLNLDFSCSPVLHFTITCQGGAPIIIPPTLEYPCGKMLEPGGGGGSSSTPPPSNGGSTPPPPTSTTPTPPSGGGGGWLGVFPTPPPTNTPPSYVDPNLGGGSNTSPSYPNNPSLPPNWEEDPNEPWFPTGRTPVNGIQYSAQLQYLIDNLQLSHEQAEWLNQHPDKVDEIHKALNRIYDNIPFDQLVEILNIHLDRLMNDPEYLELVEGYQSSITNNNPIITELIKDLLLEIGIKVGKKFLGNMTGFSDIEDAIKNASHGDYLEAVLDIIHLLAKKVPWVNALSTAKELYDLKKAAEKVWTVIEKIKRLPDNALKGLFKTLKDKTGGILEKIHIDPNSTQGFGKINYDPSDAHNFFDEFSKNVTGNLPNTFTSSNGGIGKNFSIPGFTINFYGISTSSSEPTIEIKSTTSNWTFKIRFSL